jgi:DNA-binding LytR/AlgR family response regulator
MEKKEFPYFDNLSRDDMRELFVRFLEKSANDPDSINPDPEYWGRKKFLFYSENGVNKRVKIKQIAYLKADDNYVQIHFRDRKYVLVRSSMDKILYELPYERFMKISRSHWIVPKHVTAWTKEYVRINDVELAIMKSCLPEVMYRFVILGTA